MTTKELRVRHGTRIWSPGDIHFPEQWEALLQSYRRNLPTIFRGRDPRIVLIGDTFDSYGLSRHQKAAAEMRTRGRIKDEVRAAKPHLAWMRSLAPVDVLTGNHEDWWDDVVDENPALEGFEWWDMYAEALEGCTVHPYGTALVAGKVLLCHGDELKGSLAQQSAKSVLANYPGQNSIYGHTHRLDQCTRPTVKNGDQVAHGAWTIGHSRDPIRIQRDKVLRKFAESWEPGGAVIDFFNMGQELYFNVQLYRVWRDRRGAPVYMIDGKVLR